MNVIVAWMYSPPKGQSIHHHQTGSNSDSKEIQNYYWRCVFLLFESSERHNDNMRHVLFVNELPPDVIDGICTENLINKYKIEICFLNNVTITTKEFHPSWNTQFVILDIFEQIKTMINTDDIVYILDSDMVFNKALDRDIENDVKNNKALLYSIDYDQKYNIN